MKSNPRIGSLYISLLLILPIVWVSFLSLKPVSAGPKALLLPTNKSYFNSFVDCNMAEAWIGDTFRIFPGKYGEDPLWGYSKELKFADGFTVDEAFNKKPEGFTEPLMPPNDPPLHAGLHGAVWFETVYQDPKDASGKTLYAVYHNENYPSTLPYDALSGKGYKNINWPQGLKGPASPSAVCRIGIMKSTDGGHGWKNRGILIEDLQPRLILKPHNTAANFAGGVGDPSAVASGEFLYIFFSEYGYPGVYSKSNYNPSLESAGQCISMARIQLSDLDSPIGKARRWDGKSFSVPADGVGRPITSLQIPRSEGGGPSSSPVGKYHWGPSVSWNDWLRCWVMLMAKAEGPSWNGGSIYISFNTNPDLGSHSQDWTKPELLINKPGHIIWYPSLQPTNETEDKEKKNTCLKLGERARLFYKDMFKDSSEYVSEYIVQFKKSMNE